MSFFLLILALLPGDSQPEPTGEADELPSLELLEYIGAQEQDATGTLLNPFEELPLENSLHQLPSLPVKHSPSRANPHHETP